MAYSAQRAAYYNPYIANELYKNDGRCANDTAYTRAQAQMFRRKPKSDVSKSYCVVCEKMPVSPGASVTGG